MTLTYDRQQKLIKKSLRQDLHLHEILHKEGLTYDDLVYRTSRISKLVDTDQPIGLSSVCTKYHGLPAISFFAGAGGMDLGFEAAGFQHLLSLEVNPIFCETIRSNRPHWHVCAEDLSQRERVTAVLDQYIKDLPFDGVFHGGPPCQPFSVASNQRFNKDSQQFRRIGFADGLRGSLLFDYVYYISTYRPRAFVVENVPGILELDGGIQLQAASEIMVNAGYRVYKPIILNASNYGVPQDRERLFLIGVRKDAARLNDLPSLPKMPKISCGVALSRALSNRPNHITRQHKAESINRYQELFYGQREAKGRVDRLNPDVPAKTVIAGGSKGGGRSNLHPEIPRTLSPRECAALQTFPTAYLFCGPAARQLNQVGNAVPPILAAQIANLIAAAVGSAELRKSETLKSKNLLSNVNAFK